MLTYLLTYLLKFTTKHQEWPKICKNIMIKPIFHQKNAKLQLKMDLHQNSVCSYTKLTPVLKNFTQALLMTFRKSAKSSEVRVLLRLKKRRKKLELTLCYFFCAPGNAMQCDPYISNCFFQSLGNLLLFACFNY